MEDIIKEFINKKINEHNTYQTNRQLNIKFNEHDIYIQFTEYPKEIFKIYPCKTSFNAFKALALHYDDSIFEKIQVLVDHYSNLMNKVQLLVDVDNFIYPDIRNIEFNYNYDCYFFKYPVKGKQVIAERKSFYSDSSQTTPSIKIVPEYKYIKKELKFVINLHLPIALKQTIDISIYNDFDINKSLLYIEDEIKKRIYTLINKKEKRLKKDEYSKLSFDDICKYVELFEMIDC